MRQAQGSRVQHFGFWVIAGLITLGAIIVQQGYAQDKSSTTGCTPATLKGQYIFDASGYNIVASVPQPKAVVEFLQFGGDGTLSSVATAVVNGSVVGGDFHQGTGIYTVNSDCTGTLTFDGSGFTFYLDIAPLGSSLHMIEPVAGTVLSGEAVRIG